MAITVQTLRAAGLTEAQIVRVVEIEERERLAARRERNRKYQQNHRSRQQLRPDSPDIADTNIEVRKKEREASKFIPRSARKKPMIPLPENWHPELAGDTEFEKFSDHARQNDRRCADWDAAWRNWNRNKSKFNGNGGQRNGRRHGSVLDACDRLAEKLHSQGSFGDQYVPGSAGPTPLRLDQDVRPTNLRLIPKR